MANKNIKGFEGLYQVSEYGDIFALEKQVAMPNGGFKTIKAHKPKINITHKGYHKVMLTNKLGVRKGFYVHRLVALNFIGESNLQVNHKDFNKTNNNILNLEFVTNTENSEHYFKSIKTTSKYKGICWHKNMKKWVAQFNINKIKVNVGSFNTELEAHTAYLKEKQNYIHAKKSNREAIQ